MDLKMLLEGMGYVASVLCIVSLLMADIKKLRWLNLVASGMLAFYSICVKTYPVALTNSLIAVADVYYLIKIYKAERQERNAVSEQENKTEVAV